MVTSRFQLKPPPLPTVGGFPVYGSAVSASCFSLHLPDLTRFGVWRALAICVMHKRLTQLDSGKDGQSFAVTKNASFPVDRHFRL